MSIIIKLQGLPLDAASVDVRRYFIGLTIPDGGVHIVGGDDGTVFIEFASDEDARQAMSRGDGTIKNSNVKLLLSSKSEMQSVLDTARRNHQQYLQQQLQFQQHNQIQQNQQQPLVQQPQIPSAFVDPRILSQNYQGIMAQQQVHLQQQQHHPMQPQLLPPAQPMPLLPQQNSQIFNSYPPTTNSGMTLNMLGVDMNGLNLPPMIGNPATMGIPTSIGIPNSMNLGTMNSLANVNNNNNNNANDNANRARASGMRGGDDKLFANKRCVLAASNIPYRCAAKDIIDFLSEYGIKEDCIRRRYNQKGQPTGDAKIAFPTPDAAMKALKTMNKKNLCGRPVFLKPV